MSGENGQEGEMLPVPVKRKGRGPTQPRWGVALIAEMVAEGKLYKTPEEAVKAAQEHAATQPDDMEELYLVRRIKVSRKITAVLE